MLAAVTKITLPSCRGFRFQIFLIYTTAPRVTCTYKLQQSERYVVHADSLYECEKSLGIVAAKRHTLNQSKKELLHCYY